MDHARAESMPVTSMCPTCGSSKLAANHLQGGSSSESKAYADSIERQGMDNYHPPLSDAPRKRVDWVYNPADGSVLLDHRGRPVSVDKLLATKPLRGELSTRPGPGNKKLTYISGEGVTRTLNDVFGFDGWNLEISRVQREECIKDPATSKYTVVYTAMVRLTHKASGAYKEDCGAGDATDRQFATAVAHALKASITDALKRAARHFGDKLGNSLYQGNFSLSKAPLNLKDALDQYDIERANSKFGFPKDQERAELLLPVQQSKKDNPTTESVVCSSSGAPNAHVSTSMAMPNNDVSAEKLEDPNHCQIPRTKSVQRVTTHEPKQELPGTVATTSVVYSDASTTTRSQQSQSNANLCTSRLDPQESTLHAHQQGPDPPQQILNAVTIPPPTPSDSLRRSPLFASDAVCTSKQIDQLGSSAQHHSEYSIPPKRPQSSYGHVASRTSHATSEGKSDSRRCSIGDGLPIQALPMVTPIQKNVVAGGAKRPNVASLSDIDPTHTKKVSTNPYSVSSGISRPQK